MKLVAKRGKDHVRMSRLDIMHQSLIKKIGAFQQQLIR